MSEHSTGSVRDFAAAQAALSKYFDAHFLLAEHAVQEVRATLWNAGESLTPAGLVRCRDVADVRFVLQATQDYGIPVSVLSGGHDPSVRSARNGAIVLDLRLMSSVTFLGNQNLIDVGGGAVTRDVLDRLPPDKVVVTGTFQSVGLASFVMGGGYGRLNSYFGMGVDQLVGGDLLLADGRAVRVDETQNQELFWAIRG